VFNWQKILRLADKNTEFEICAYDLCTFALNMFRSV